MNIAQATYSLIAFNSTHTAAGRQQVVIQLLQIVVRLWFSCCR
jgi:hypothetical protein